MSYRWLMLSTGLLFAATGLVACGDDEDPPCETHEDCAEGELCVGPEDGAKECEQLCETDADCNRAGEVCVEVPPGSNVRAGTQICEPAVGERSCSVDTDCETGEICLGGFCTVPAEECTSDEDCGEGFVCVEGACTETGGTCTDNAACYEDTGYCGATTTGNECVDMSCGATFNACGRCSLGPNGGQKSANGPVLFFPSQVGSCVAKPGECEPGAAPYSCTFSFQAFDPDGDLPTSGLNQAIRVVSRTGQLLSVFGTSSTGSGNERTYQFKACFPETSSGSIGTAVVLQDNGGNYSQTLCVSGELPR